LFTDEDEGEVESGKYEASDVFSLNLNMAASG